jgi:two-component system sensor histidine kinase YesM
MPEQKVEALNRMFAEDDPERSAYCGQRADRPARGGIGLRNVNQRMKLFYGKAYGLRAESKEGEYTRICMSVPYIDSGGEL